MKALVTGATGFVGAAVTRRLLAEGHEVRVLVRPHSDRRNLAGLPVELTEGDLRDVPSLERALKGCNALFHVAADYRLWVRDERELYATNVDGTRNIMLAALQKGVERIVYTSSVATLGLLPDGTPADEETPVTLAEMIGPYKRSKFLAEAEVRRLVRQESLPAVIVNPSTPVGPGDVKPTPTGRMVLDAAAGRMPAYVDTGLNIVHVDDVALGHVRAWERGTVGERYILGGFNMSLREILTMIAQLTGGRPPGLRLPCNLVLPLAYLAEAWTRLTGAPEPRLTVVGVRLAKKKMFFSSDKVKRILGIQPRPAVEAFRDAIAWYRQHDYL